MSARLANLVGCQADASRLSARLKNIEETEKAKRAVAEARKEGKRRNDEEHLVATRCTAVSLLLRNRLKLTFA